MCDELMELTDKKFLSTPSARRATNQAQEQRQDTSISIHALREEGDIVRPFYPGGDYEFLSTPSARRATNNPDDGKRTDRFLSTPSARRATRRKRPNRRSRKNFYPRPPRGGRPQSCGRCFRVLPISIHALREEGDQQ